MQYSSKILYNKFTINKWIRLKIPLDKRKIVCCIFVLKNKQRNNKNKNI